MLNSLFHGVFDTELTTVITPYDFLLCVGVSLLIGLMLCAMTMWRQKSSGVFDPVLKEYTSEYTLTQVKTTNMGSLFKLTYDLILLDPSKEKKFIDELRCRNGNLEISVSYQETVAAGL